jgi:hypothetical protein
MINRLGRIISIVSGTSGFLLAILSALVLTGQDLPLPEMASPFPVDSDHRIVHGNLVSPFRRVPATPLLADFRIRCVVDSDVPWITGSTASPI